MALEALEDPRDLVGLPDLPDLPDLVDLPAPAVREAPPVLAGMFRFQEW